MASEERSLPHAGQAGTGSVPSKGVPTLANREPSHRYSEDHLLVVARHIVGIAAGDKHAPVKDERATAEALQQVDIVANEEDRHAAAADVPHLLEALLLELRVADRQGLVDYKDLRLAVDGNGE